MDDSVVDLNSGHNTPKKPVLAPSHCGLPQGHWRLSCTRKKGGRSVFIDRSKGVTLNLQIVGIQTGSTSVVTNQD